MDKRKSKALNKKIKKQKRARTIRSKLYSKSYRSNSSSNSSINLFIISKWWPRWILSSSSWCKHRCLQCSSFLSSSSTKPHFLSRISSNSSKCKLSASKCLKMLKKKKRMLISWLSPIHQIQTQSLRIPVTLHKLHLHWTHRQVLKTVVCMSNKRWPKLKCLPNFNRNNNSSRMLVSNRNKTFRW